MAQPTPYTQSTDFEDELGTAHGNHLDVEFANIKQTLDQILANIAIVQRDDTKLANLSVHPDALTPATLSLVGATLNPAGDWVTATAYEIGDLVNYSGSSYVCAEAHTSGTFATDLAAAKWNYFANASINATAVAATPGTAMPGATVQSRLDEADAILSTQFVTTQIADEAITAAKIDATYEATLLKDGDIGVPGGVQEYDANIVKSNVTRTLTKGYTLTPYDEGTKTTGVFTPDEANGNYQFYTNNGAHTLAPPANSASICILMTNDLSAGTVTTSGFTKVTGSSLTTTNGHKFLFFINKIGSTSHLNVVALQ